MNNIYEYNWADIVFGNKKPLRDLNATFIAAPREMSDSRIKHLVKQYLPIGNIIFGCADEKYVSGFENQSQFKTLQAEQINGIANKVNNSASPHKIIIFHFSQSDISSIYKKIKFRQVILVNGSWKYSFHTRPEYYVLVSQKIKYIFVSPFTDENEAREYANDYKSKIVTEDIKTKLSDLQMMEKAKYVATNSFDNGFQVGVSLGKKIGNKYKFISASFNSVVPFQTFAWHYGAQREINLSQPGDLNNYDTIHAEVNLIVKAVKNRLDINGSTMFTTMLPCPICAKILCETDINEIVYSIDHSDGYAIALLEKSGKIVRRLVDNDKLINMEG